MRLKKAVIGIMAMGLGVLSSGQAFAAQKNVMMYSGNIASYTLKDSTKASLLESEYKQKVLGILKDYFDIDQAQISANAEFTVQENQEKDIRCEIMFDQPGIEAGGQYVMTFDSKTKELKYLDAPLSKEGMEYIRDDKTAKIAVRDFENKYAELIKKYAIGGVKNPKCIKAFSGDNGNLPVLIYQDENDGTKGVTIGLDKATGGIFYILTGYNNGLDD